MPTQAAISPAIFYWGTPVVLLTTTNPDGTTNIAPMSSAWWLGNRCMLGLARASQTSINLLRTKQCVLNLASEDMAATVNALAKTTGNALIDDFGEGDDGRFKFKRENGYEFVKDKWTHARLTPLESEVVAPQRIAHCPAQMEAEFVGVYEMTDGEEGKGMLALDVRVLRTHVHQAIRMEGKENRIDPTKWRPLIMCFQELYGLKDGKVEDSRLAEIGEEAYRSRGF